MNKNYLLSWQEHLPQRPMCHWKIRFSRGRLSKCKALGKCALESPRDLGERENSYEGGMPLQPGKMPAWTRGKHSVSGGLITELLEQEAPDSHQSHRCKSHEVTALLVNTIVLSCLRGLEARISVRAVKLENKGWKHGPPLRHLPLSLRTSVQQQRVGRQHGGCILTWASAVDYWLLSCLWLTSVLWLNTNMDLATTTGLGIVVLSPGLTFCFGNKFPPSTVILSACSKLFTEEREEGLLFLTHVGSSEMEHGALPPKMVVSSAFRWTSAANHGCPRMTQLTKRSQKYVRVYFHIHHHLAVLKCINFHNFRHLFMYIVRVSQIDCLQLNLTVLCGSQRGNHMDLGQNTQGAQWIQLTWLNGFICNQPSPLFFKGIALNFLF